MEVKKAIISVEFCHTVVFRQVFDRPKFLPLQTKNLHIFAATVNGEMKNNKIVANKLEKNARKHLFQSKKSVSFLQQF